MVIMIMMIMIRERLQDDSVVSQDSVYNNSFKWNKRFNIPELDDVVYETQTHCYICENIFETEKPVIGHDLFTGEFRGLAHKECGLKLKEPLLIAPIVAHNSSRYDNHLFIGRIF